jgi:hypothetical protein
VNSARPAQSSRPSRPASTYRDDAYVPLHEAGCDKANTISVKTKVIYFSPAVFTSHDALNALGNFAVWRGNFSVVLMSLRWPLKAKSRTDLPDGSSCRIRRRKLH